MRLTITLSLNLMRGNALMLASRAPDVDIPRAEVDGVQWSPSFLWYGILHACNKKFPVLFLTLSCVLVEINLLYCFTFGFRLFFKICDLQVVKFESNVQECDPLDCALNMKIKELMQMKILNKRKWFCHSEIIQSICFSALLYCSSQSPPWQNLLLPKAIPPNLVTQREQQQCKWVKFTFLPFQFKFLGIGCFGRICM